MSAILTDLQKLRCDDIVEFKKTMKEIEKFKNKFEKIENTKKYKKKLMKELNNIKIQKSVEKQMLNYDEYVKVIKAYTSIEYSSQLVGDKYVEIDYTLELSNLYIGDRTVCHFEKGYGLGEIQNRGGNLKYKLDGYRCFYNYTLRCGNKEIDVMDYLIGHLFHKLTNKPIYNIAIS